MVLNYILGLSLVGKSYKTSYTGCPRKMSLSEIGALLTKVHFFLGHLVYTPTLTFASGFQANSSSLDYLRFTVDFKSRHKKNRKKDFYVIIIIYYLCHCHLSIQLIDFNVLLLKMKQEPNLKIIALRKLSLIIKM